MVQALISLLQRLGFSNKLEKVSINTNSKTDLDWCSLEHQGRAAVPPKPESPRGHKESRSLYYTKNLNQEGIGVVSGYYELCWNLAPGSKVPQEPGGSFLEAVPQTKADRGHYFRVPETNSILVAKSRSVQEAGSSQIPSGVCLDMVGRVGPWLGCSQPVGRMGGRSLLPDRTGVTHKSEGGTSSLSGSTDLITTRRLLNYGHHRQCDHGTCPEILGVQEIYQPDERSATTSGSLRRKTLASGGVKNSLVSKRAGRPSIKENHPPRRVVLNSINKGRSFSVGGDSSGGSNGDSLQRASGGVRISLSPSQSPLAGRKNDGLVVLDNGIHLPSPSHDQVGTGEDLIVQGENNPYFPTSPELSAVVDPQQPFQVSAPPSRTSRPMGPEQLDSFPGWLSLDCNTFCAAELAKVQGDLVAGVLMSAKRPSTRRQQEAPWLSFKNWLKSKIPLPIVTTSTCLEFLVHLSAIGYASGTIKAYQNALAL